MTPKTTIRMRTVPVSYTHLIKTPVLNETQIADNMIDENFTKSNLVALVVPKNDDYRVEDVYKRQGYRRQTGSP